VWRVCGGLRLVIGVGVGVVHCFVDRRQKLFCFVLFSRARDEMNGGDDEIR
jgi:hypothetical protein